MEELLSNLSTLTDSRRKAGTRHQQHIIIFLFILATLQGSRGRRSVAKFIKSNEEILYKLLPLKKQRLPSGSTIERTLKRVCPQALGSLLSSWEQKYVPVDSLLVIASDAQALGSTLIHPHSSAQNYVSVCSFFSILLGTVVQVQHFENKQESEVHVLQQMITNSPFAHLLLMADALHTQKNISPMSSQRL